MDENEPVERIRNGEIERFREIVETHQDLALSIARRVAGNRHDAEEVCQTAFLRAFRTIGSFRGDARLATWIARIVYRHALNHIRGRRAEAGFDEASYASASGVDSSERLTERIALEQANAKLAPPRTRGDNALSLSRNALRPDSERRLATGRNGEDVVTPRTGACRYTYRSARSYR
ncbi:MAG: sigma-70 family RNA polymerase sigma factor [Spirochaetales bacterium]|nr:sigma-70 family RNA polymerase sigma factor [Spirochaetales bacterium]